MAKKKVLKKAYKKKKLKANKVATPLEEQARKEGMPVFAKEDMLSGNYSNVAVISHTEREFVLDFIFAFTNQHSLVSRVITSPQHVKKIYEVLGENIKRYEKKFGGIKV